MGKKKNIEENIESIEDGVDKFLADDEEDEYVVDDSLESDSLEGDVSWQEDLLEQNQSGEESTFEEETHKKEKKSKKAKKEEKNVIDLEKEHRKRYFKEVNSYPNLLEEEEKELVRIYKDKNETKENVKAAKDKLVNSYMKLVAHCAVSVNKNYQNDDFRDHKGKAGLWDLIAGGTAGFYKALDKYDYKSTSAANLGAFSKWYILKGIYLEINGASESFCSVKDTILLAKVKSIENEYYIKNGKEADEIVLLQNFEYSGKGKVSEYYYCFLVLYKELLREPSDKEIIDVYKKMYGDTEKIVIEGLKKREHKFVKGDISKYDFTLMRLWKSYHNSKSGSKPTDMDILYVHRDFLGHIRALKAWTETPIPIDPGEDEDRKGVSEIKIAKEQPIDLGDDYDFNLTAVEMIVLNIEGKIYIGRNDYFDEKFTNNIVDLINLPKKGSKEYKAILKRAENKLYKEKFGQRGIVDSVKNRRKIEIRDITRRVNGLISEMNQSLDKIISKEELMAQYSLMLAAQADDSSEEALWRSKIINALKQAGYDIPSEAGSDFLREKIENLKNRENLLVDLTDALYSIYKKFPVSQDYLRRVIDNCGCEYIKEDDSVRVAIVKQFMAKTKYFTNVVNKMIKERVAPELARCGNNSPEIIEAVDERVFKIYESFVAEEKKKDKYTLLRMAQDLQDGLFKTNYSTRKDLYYFAFAFELKAYDKLNISKEEYNPVNDLEKNLFEDYYNNDYVAYLRSGAANTYETEPTGEGINYKNFIELIYIYYLNRDDLSVQERINGAEDTIGECIRTFKEDDALGEMTREDDKTSVYRNEFWSIMGKDCTKDDLIDFIYGNCIISEMSLSGNGLGAAALSLTALEETEKLVKKLKKDRIDRNEVQEVLISKIEDIVNGDDDKYPDKEDFLAILRKLNSLLDFSRLNIDSPQYKQSRTKLLVAAYMVYKMNNDPSELTFMQLFNSFAITVNNKLIESRYQTLSKKNILDVYLVLVLYYTYSIL